MPELPVQHIQRNVTTEADFLEMVDEAKTKLIRRIVIFVLLAAVSCAVLFGIFYGPMKNKGYGQF